MLARYGLEHDGRSIARDLVDLRILLVTAPGAGVERRRRAGETIG